MFLADRTLKPDGTAIVIMGYNNLHHVLNQAIDLKWYLVNHCIWKYPFGVYCERRFVASHYHILFYAKNEKNFYFDDWKHYPEDVFEFNKALDKHETTTPNKLPSELVEFLLKFTTAENDLVLDPFAGSGSTGVACKKLGRRFMGFEIVKEYADLANSRIAETRIPVQTKKVSW
jgi:DNA modification methylase